MYPVGVSPLHTVQKSVAHAHPTHGPCFCGSSHDNKPPGNPQDVNAVLARLQPTVDTMAKADGRFEQQIAGQFLVRLGQALQEGMSFQEALAQTIGAYQELQKTALMGRIATHVAQQAITPLPNQPEPRLNQQG